jgi:SHS2 domain-containing protein
VTGRYEILEHTADVGIAAAGETLEEVFEAAGEALAGLLDAWFPGEGEPRDATVEAPDQEALLVGWLDELLYLHEAHDLVFGGFAVRDVSAGTLRASVTAASRGDRVLEGVGVKAATYHDIEVAEHPDGWRTRVYLDV